MDSSIADNKAVGSQNTRDVNRVDGSVVQLTQRLEQGQGQRIQNDRDQADKLEKSAREQAEKIAQLDTKLAVLSSKQDTMTATLERLLRKIEEVRWEGDRPFGQDQNWPGLLTSPYSLRAKVECRMLSPLVREVALRG
jgi:septal ring factor EnvC (AmiA/AmiB activator)